MHPLDVGVAEWEALVLVEDGLLLVLAGLLELELGACVEDDDGAGADEPPVSAFFAATS